MYYLNKWEQNFEGLDVEARKTDIEIVIVIEKIEGKGKSNSRGKRVISCEANWYGAYWDNK